MSKKGFTLIELMVAVVIVGILAGIAVPKLFGNTAKAKATEVNPAAMTYTKLQQAYLLEFKGIGTWKKIGYEAPGGGETSNFKYSKGDVRSSVKKSLLKTTFSGEGKIGWMADNVVGMNDCHLGNKWVVSIIASGDSDIELKRQLVNSPTSQYCAALTGSDWGSVDIQVAVNTPEPGETPQDPDPVIPETNEDETPVVPPTPSTPEPEDQPVIDPDQQTFKACASTNGDSWLNGVKAGWEHQDDKKDCIALRNQLIESGKLVCEKNPQGHCTNTYVFVSPEEECRVTGNNCN